MPWDWIDPLFRWFNAAPPLTWLSHTLVWLGLQGVGGLLDGALALAGLSWRVSLLRAGYWAGVVFYGQRELISVVDGVATTDLLLVGDSVMDFALPLIVNLVVARWLWRRHQARRAGAQEGLSVEAA